MTLACGLTTCVAFAATTDIVALFLGIIVTAIAKMLLNAADIIVTPLLAITSMTTQEIEAYIPGLNNSDPNGVGNFFSSAISIIAYTIAGVLLCCHIISYLIALANDERLESVPKLIWNGMFGIVLTIAGKNLLSLLFNEIIAPLSEALVDGMQSAGGMSFTFEGKANDIISLGDGISAFDLTALGTLFVVLVMLLLIWWNLVKLILECAQRYIICVVTINLSPLAFATATTEQTKETAMNWLKMFWSQCVLLVLNIWVVGIARTALNNGMIGGSSTELVTWALITYAFLKIAQQLDDMMQAAGLKVTRMNGIDPFSEAQGVMRNLTGIGAAVNTALGYGKGALDTLRSDKASGDGKNPTLTEADLNRAEADFDKTDAQRKTGLDKGSINTASYNDDAHKKAMENVLKTEGALKEGEQVEGVKIGEDGALNATAVKRDERGRITSSREIKATNTGDGLGLTPAETPTSSLRVGNGGKSAIVANEKGTFKLESQGKNEEGENVWKATQLTDANGNKISDVAPETDEEKSLVPQLGEDYILPKEVVTTCHLIARTRGTARPMTNVMLRGDPSVGKTAGARAIAAGLGLPYTFITCNAGTEMYNLIGDMMPVDSSASADSINEELFKDLPSATDISMDPAAAYEAITGSEKPDATEVECMTELFRKQMKLCADACNNGFKYVESPLVRAIRNGWVCELQEPSLITRPAVMPGLNGLLDETGCVVLPTGEMLHRHPDCIIISTLNIDLEGCRPLNQAFMDRHHIIMDMQCPTDDVIVKRIKGMTGCGDDVPLKEMVQCIHQIATVCARHGATDGNVNSMRSLANWVQAGMLIGDYVKAAEWTVVSGATSDPETRTELSRTVANYSF